MMHENERVRREFAARLNEALDDLKIPNKDKGRQTRAGKLFGVSQKGVRKWLEGEGLPKTNRIAKMATLLGVRQEWLLFGLGPKRPIQDKVNTMLIQRIIVAMEYGLKTGNIHLTEEQKTHLVTSLYDSLSQ